MKPFIPYEISQNGTADILISQTGDGQISLQLPPDGPQAEIKVYQEEILQTHQQH